MLKTLFWLLMPGYIGARVWPWKEGKPTRKRKPNSGHIKKTTVRHRERTKSQSL